VYHSWEISLLFSLVYHEIVYNAIFSAGKKKLSRLSCCSLEKHQYSPYTETIKLENNKPRGA
jgi:hypothetical protein